MRQQSGNGPPVSAEERKGSREKSIHLSTTNGHHSLPHAQSHSRRRHTQRIQSMRHTTIGTCTTPNTLMRRQTQFASNGTMTPHKPPLCNVTIGEYTDPQTNGATVLTIAAICVREVYDQSVLQFTINHKVCFALPRYTSRVIHRSKFLFLCSHVHNETFR